VSNTFINTPVPIHTTAIEGAQIAKIQRTIFQEASYNIYYMHIHRDQRHSSVSKILSRVRPSLNCLGTGNPIINSTITFSKQHCQVNIDAPDFVMLVVERIHENLGQYQ